ncbi:hypothetical protein [Amycolatopsis sp. NPDC051903]|uniref:hypothetical protein n=1 Tax=Amycolatopsis sp. NPDC051903 TaxID=3363936 RepID=UPI0037AF9673
MDVLPPLQEIMERIEAASAEVRADERAFADHQHTYVALMHLGCSQFLSQDPSTS